MNYLAHGRKHLGRPYFLAGTAVPDWMNVVDRRIRVRSSAAAKHVGDQNPHIQDLAAGIVQHHCDDGWFHQTRAFAELSLSLTVSVRDRLPGDHGFRPSFLGHILVELLLDAVLIEKSPALLSRYYAALARVEPPVVAEGVTRFSGKDAGGLAPLIPRFIRERFLADYGHDDRLLMRLNQVMRRVGLHQLPAAMSDVFPVARRSVRERADELLQS